VINRLLRGDHKPFVENAVALVGAMVSLGLATLWVARAGGPAAVGVYALLRILPWLVAVLVSGGLASSLAYFLAGPTQKDPQLRPTIVSIGLLSAGAGSLLWLAGSPLLHATFFRQLALGLVAVVAVRVALRLFVITGKAAAQGERDLRGSNLTIFLEETLFLPAYGLMLFARMPGDAAVIGGLILADLTTGSIAWARLLHRGFLRGSGRPSLSMARRIYLFSVRGQLGSLMTLLNLRFDFIFLAALAGPATLGVYAVASKYAETLRLVPIAANWVLYPRFAAADSTTAVTSSRRFIVRAGAITAGASIPLALGASLVVPLIFGGAFKPAVLPAQILLVGLAAEGVAGVVTAFLYGRGRPGLNSIAAGIGVVVTLVMDVVLIPRFGAVGAAVASSAAYLTTTATLVVWYRHTSRGIGPKDTTPVFDGMPSIAPSRGRRTLDLIVSVLALAVTWPLLVVLLLGARASTRGSAIYRQVRVGQGGVPFTMYKIRSMRAESGGPEITAPDDKRVTHLGALLRASSLDELPQLINVLRGEMTLVGARPETVALAHRYPPESRSVFAHRPGLTGPVQIRLRDAVPPVADPEAYYLEELLPTRIALDLEFLSNPTLLATLGLMAETAVHVLWRIVRKTTARFHTELAELRGAEDGAVLRNLRIAAAGAITGSDSPLPQPTESEASA
jgi:lipopolysaccharide/colanic/teichoic acid biosynthesis glycosyltransferase/O-antigen/teichoic acid export membrane protein